MPPAAPDNWELERERGMATMIDDSTAHSGENPLGGQHRYPGLVGPLSMIPDRKPLSPLHGPNQARMFP